MTIPRDENIGLDIAEYLASKWGFEHHGTALYPGEFRLVVDAQHTAVVVVEPWDEKGPGGGSLASIRLGVGRRDLNELWTSTFGPGRPEPTCAFVREGQRFFGRRHASWLRDADRSEMRQWCDEWITRLVTEAMCLDWIVAYMNHEPTFDESVPPERQAEARRLHRQKMRGLRMLNAMLEGWTDAHETEFLDPLRSQVDRLTQAGKPAAEALSRRLQNIETWIAKHPNGIDRDLV